MLFLLKIPIFIALVKGFPARRGVGFGVRLAISYFALGIFHFAFFVSYCAFRHF
jgi:hypothetical protein